MCRVLLLFVLFVPVLFCQEDDSLRGEVESLKEMVKSLLEQNKEAQKEINNIKEESKKQIDNLKSEISDLKGQMSQDANSSGVAIKDETLYRETDLIISNSDFALEEDEETSEGDWVAELGFVEQISQRVSDGALTIGGFFTMEYLDFDSSNATSEIIFPSTGTFSNSHINLYFDTTFYENFRFYTELRFLYQPFTVVVDTGNTEFSGEVIIERAWVEWQYADWLKVRAGTFFVPYGIWNLEHSDPILLSGFVPAIILAEIFPDRVTGLQVYGTIPLGNSDLLYYAWIANGKGQQSAILDEQENKAFGARLEWQLPFIHQMIREMAVGVSGYYGKVKGIAQNFITDFVFLLEGNAAAIGDFAAQGYNSSGEPVDTYVDRAIGVDFKLRLGNFILQSEVVVNFVDPTDSGVVNLGGAQVKVGPGDSFREYGAYIQLAYEIDLSMFGISGFLTPYTRFEVAEANDNVDDEFLSGQIYTFGLNWRVNPHVVLKVEYTDLNLVVSDRDVSLFLSSLTVGF